MSAYRAIPGRCPGDWVVQQLVPCINGVKWLVVADCHYSEPHDTGDATGIFGNAETHATRIARALCRLDGVDA